MTKEVDNQYYDSQDIAALMKMSLRWVVKHRHKIVGAKRVGRVWRFARAIIDAYLASGKDIIIKK